jgi:hypothetical protein
MWKHPSVAISVDDYLAAVRRDLPESHAVVARLADTNRDISLVVQVNIALTYLLVWSWTARNLDVCARVLGVMELAVVDTEDGDFAPVFNSVAIGMVEHVHRDLYMPDDFAEFVVTWPPTLREYGANMTRFDEDFDEDWEVGGPHEFHIPLGMRARWALRHPISSRLGTRMRIAG